ncbi:cysteine--tRNA ligase [Candidatus Undinarchaeota archaeon]
MRVYNSLTNKKEEFKPIEDKHITMYVCGPTVYDYSHLGHARAYIAFDIVNRYFQYKGYDVNYIQNITDVDDKIINRANESKRDPSEIAEEFTDKFLEDMDSLGIQRPTHQPKATDVIPEMIKIIKTLIKKGYAYDVDGDVYFSLKKFENYGKLSGQTTDQMKAGARVCVDEKKKDPFDFALWKKSKPGEPKWESPWGEGRPGWHIECSAMSMKFGSETLDIHAGGQDLIFPHHENEIAQSEAYTGKPFAKYWLHNGFVTINKEKMSKSLGNFFTIRDILKKYSPLAVRFSLLSTSYRSPIDFSDELLEQAGKAAERLVNTLELLKEGIGSSKEKPYSDDEKKLSETFQKKKEEFLKAMDDDFNTSEAVARLFELSTEVHKYLENPDTNSKLLSEALAIFEDLDQILGLFQLSKKELPIPEDEINKMIQKREAARNSKDYATSDKIRDELLEKGILLEDQKDGGVRWKVKPK